TMGDRHRRPFPSGRRPEKFLLVAVDYFTKWVEAEPLARITEGEAKRYRNGAKACASSKDSPQWLILRPMGKLRSQIASWTTPRGSTGETPFSLVYGTEAIIPAKLGMPSYRVMNFSEECNEDLLRENLDLIEELREKASTHTKIQEYHDQFLQQKSKITKFPSGRFDATKGRRPEANRQARSYLGRTIQGSSSHRGRPLLRSSEGPSIHKGQPLLRSSKGSPIHMVHPPAQAGPSVSLGPEEEGEVPSGTEAGAGGASKGPAGGIAGAFFSAGSPSLGDHPSMESVAATGEDSSLLPPLHLGGYQGHPLIKKTDDG
ncbi:UNVERIFIED_CONTAM: hypothetical protein Slati_0133500, partial [Sesamum latifolium]